MSENKETEELWRLRSEVMINDRLLQDKWASVTYLIYLPDDTAQSE